MTSPLSESAPTARRASGLLIALAAYALWGLFPLYFLLLAPADPPEIVGWRVLLTFVACIVAVTVLRGWGPLVAAIRTPRVVITLAIAGVLILVNWLVYVLAVASDRVVEGALGYFITPVLTVLLGAIVLREKVRPAQWVAIGVATVAILVIAIGYGTFPWISVVLAVSFGLYGLVKNLAGTRVDALTGLSIETAATTPIAIVLLIVVALGPGIVTGTAGAGQAIALAFAGVITATPLLMFAVASRRIPLVWIGLAQFLTPIMQFVVGVWLLNEPMPLERWIGFALVWVAVAVLAGDTVVTARRSRRARSTPAVGAPGL